MPEGGVLSPGPETVRLLARRVRTAAPALGSVRLVAVDGPSGSGKSTLARELVRELSATGIDVCLVPTDDFATWEEPVQWWPRLAEGVLEPLARGSAGHYRRVEWPRGRPVPGAVVEVAVPDVLVVEGVSSGRRQVADRLSLLIWVEMTGERRRLERAVTREGETARDHLVAWQRFERCWFDPDRTRERADLLVDPGLSAQDFAF